MPTRRDFTNAVLAALAVSPVGLGLLARNLSGNSGSVPPDLPLPASRPSLAAWIRKAMILQPWAKTQFLALTNVGDRPRRLRQEFGFNALIVLPTDAHNALSGPQFHLSDTQFRSAVEAYRKAGYRLILYSSVMHCGHAPVWQSGQLEREHPEWAQRDARGEPVTEFGHAWLCASTPARDYTLDYTLRLVHDYSADGIMLDNNGFGHTANGWTCYCDGCQSAFHNYVLRRCGGRWIEDQLGIRPKQLKIPIDPGPLFALWTRWRNRVWAGVNELFRSRLRQVNPEILFFANTQYDLPVNTQGSNLQFQREDVVFSESHEVDTRYLSEKMAFGKGLAPDVPLWNYIGTFAETPEGAGIDRLRSPEAVSRVICASLAHGTRPWIVYFGLEDPGSRPARREMAKILSWYAAHPELFAGRPFTIMAALVSLRERDLFQGAIQCTGQGVTGCRPASPGQNPLIPRHLGPLLSAGVPAIVLRETYLSRDSLRPLRFVTLESGRAIGGRQAQALAAWVRAGGFLIAAPDAGEYDELGRKLPRSVLFEALGVHREDREAQRAGRGKVLVAGHEQFTEAVLGVARSAGVPFTMPSGVEAVCFRTVRHDIIHFFRHDSGTDAVSVQFPSWLGARPGPAAWYSPDWKGSRTLKTQRAERSVGITFPELPLYSAISFPRKVS
ncbi:MAG TPA: alpha-amylase family protein [Terriglobia bacterium]|nr:alpha-amylase family protein [Terriglobia bacterium]